MCNSWYGVMWSVPTRFSTSCASYQKLDLMLQKKNHPFELCLDWGNETSLLHQWMISKTVRRDYKGISTHMRSLFDWAWARYLQIRCLHFQLWYETASVRCKFFIFRVSSTFRNCTKTSLLYSNSSPNRLTTYSHSEGSFFKMCKVRCSSKHFLKDCKNQKQRLLKISQCQRRSESWLKLLSFWIYVWASLWLRFVHLRFRDFIH